VSRISFLVSHASHDLLPGTVDLGSVRHDDLVLRHRLLVSLTWLALFVAGGLAASPATNRLTFDFSLPGQPGYQAEEQLIDTFGTTTADTLVPVITVPAGQTVQQRAADIAKVFDTVRTQVPQARIVDLGSTGDARFVTDDGRSTFALVQGPMPEGFGPGLEQYLTPALTSAATSADKRVRPSTIVSRMPPIRKRGLSRARTSSIERLSCARPSSA